MILNAFTDGASRGNPGESGIGILIKDEQGKILFSAGGYLGHGTNNRAEYAAVLELLKRITHIECTKLIVHSDSELMVKQLTGEYKVKDQQIAKYYQSIMDIIRKSPFEIQIRHIPRETNREADRLANEGIATRRRLRKQIEF